MHWWKSRNQKWKLKMLHGVILILILLGVIVLNVLNGLSFFFFTSSAFLRRWLRRALMSTFRMRLEKHRKCKSSARTASLVTDLLQSFFSSTYWKVFAPTCRSMLASYTGKLSSVKELRHHGATFDKQDKGGSTALHWAMDSGNVELIDWMLDNGGNIEATDYNGWTPLLRVGE